MYNEDENEVVQEDDVQDSEETAEEPEAEGTEPEQQEAQEQPQQKLLGKFNTPEEMAASYAELERKLGEQGNELGTHKQMNQMMLEQLKQYSGQQKTAPTQAEAEEQVVDYDGQLKAMSQAVEAGELSIGEALIKSNAIAKEQATRQALQEYEKLNQKKSIEQTKAQFLKQNPDFTQLQQGGVLEQVKQELPGLHDDFSAYYALKAKQAQQAVTAKQETQRIAKGDSRTEKVLQKPGTPQTRNIGKPQGKMSDFQIKQSMLKKMGG